MKKLQLLGDITPAEFLRDYWHKKPLLIRQAIPGMQPLLSVEQLAELARSGVLVRMYLPYGKEDVAGPYCKRRLQANPNMISYGIKNLLHIK